MNSECRCAVWNRLFTTIVLVALATGLAGCTSGWMYVTNFNGELIGQSNVEFENGWQSETNKLRVSNGKPYRVETDQIDGANYKLQFWRLYTQYSGTWDHDEWVAFRNGKIAAFGEGNATARYVEQSWQTLNNFGRVPVAELDSIKVKAIEQSMTDPICGLVRSPNYGPDGLVAIVHTPDTSPWKYQAVVVEFRFHRVLGAVDFYLSPIGNGQYGGQNLWWNSQGYPIEISKCNFYLTTHSTAQLVSTVQGQSEKMPLRLVSQEGRREQIAVVPSASSGTGWIGLHGLIVTNFHVVQNASLITVFLEDGREAIAEIVASDTTNDLALLKIDIDNLPKGLNIRSNAVALGEEIITLGYPLTQMLGESIKMGRGSVSSTTGLEGQSSHIQIDAPVHPGNSGGPVFSMDGQVVGIIIARLRDEVVYEESGVLPQNINYAIKAAYLSPLYSMVETRSSHPTITAAEGLSVQAIVKEVQQSVVRIESKR